MSVIASTAGLAKVSKTLPIALVAAAALALLSAAGGFYAGQQYEQGRAAIAALPVLHANAAVLAQQAEALRVESIAAQDRFRRSALALELVRTRYEASLDEIDRIAAAHGAALDDYLAARPDLSEPRLDADGVRLWNAAARGAEPAQPTAAGASGRPAQPLPGDAAGAAGGRQRGGHAASVDAGSEAIPDLPQPPSLARGGTQKL